MITKHIVHSAHNLVHECSRMGIISAVYELHQLDLIHKGN